MTGSATATPERQYGQHRPTVLIVDDTPENLTVLGGLLQPYYRVRVASSAARALAAVHTEPRPDLILLDVMMPEMDGYAVLTRLKDNPRTSDIPVIFVTALDAADDEARGIELGAADYLTKPIRPGIMLARVRGQLELKQARDHMRNQNAWLEAEVDRRVRENELIQDISIHVLASLAETRDSETGNHILRTQSYVETLCTQLYDSGHHRQALNHRTSRLITKAAALHDIGKVGIPDSILRKPGKLTEAEWAVMRTHTTMGAEAIQRVIPNESDQSAFEFLHIAIDIARSHHERWDGSGYPDGLQGDAIPLSARLMALADVFDALVSRRVYKSAMTVEESTAIILEGRGKHFDPVVVDAFLAQANDFCNIATRYTDAPGL